MQCYLFFNKHALPSRSLSFVAKIDFLPKDHFMFSGKNIYFCLKMSKKGHCCKQKLYKWTYAAHRVVLTMFD